MIMEQKMNLSKFAQAEEKWGLDLVASVFKEANNRGKAKAFIFFEERENYRALDCLRFLFGYSRY
jgi:hypothetical protein